MRSMYYMLNHILYNPVLPFDLYSWPNPSHNLWQRLSPFKRLRG